MEAMLVIFSVVVAMLLSLFCGLGMAMLVERGLGLLFSHVDTVRGWLAPREKEPQTLARLRAMGGL